MLAFIEDWVYRWKHARALLHLGNAWFYMFKKNHPSRVLLPGDTNPIDAGDRLAEDILQALFWEMHSGKPWVP
jgi:hypothetical protein